MKSTDVAPRFAGRITRASAQAARVLAPAMVREYTSAPSAWGITQPFHALPCQSLRLERVRANATDAIPTAAANVRGFRLMTLGLRDQQPLRRDLSPLRVRCWYTIRPVTSTGALLQPSLYQLRAQF
eukprot:4350447-Amphidinium_carterae.1